MPQVPYQPIPDVAPSDQLAFAPELRIRAEPAAFGVNVAQAIQHLGTTEEAVGGELFSRALAMQQLRNETAATNAKANFQLQGEQSFTDFESKKGVNAVDAHEGFTKGINDLRQSFRDSLPNDMARKMFDSEALGIQARLLIAGGRHAASQNASAAQNASQARIDSAVNSSRYGASEEDFNAQLGVIERQARDQADLAGLDKDSADQHVWKWQSAARAHRIQDVARNDPLAAKKMFDEAMSAGQLHGNDVDKTWNFVQGHLDHVGSQVVADRARKPMQDPEGFLRERGAPRTTGIDPNFGRRLSAAIAAGEAATGQKGGLESLVRTTEEQARIRAAHEAMPGGVELHPAAKPGTSRHEFGMAADLKPGPVTDWVRAHAAEFGLELLKGKTGRNDPNHIQLASGDPVPDRSSVTDVPLKHREAIAVAEADRVAPENPEFREFVVSKVRAQYREEAYEERQARQQNYDTTIDPIVNKGAQTLEDVLKDPAANAAYFQLDNKAKLAVQRLVAGKKQQTDNAEYERLTGLATSQSTEEQQHFLDEDVVHNTKLSAATQREMIRMQNKVRLEGSADPRMTPAINSLLYSGILTQDQFKDKEFMPQFRGALWGAIKAHEQAYGTYPKPEEIRELGRGLLKQIVPEAETVPLGAGFGARGAQVPRFGSISAYYGGSAGPTFQVRRAEIIEQWAKAHNNVPPTEEQIRQVMQAEMYQELYGKSKSK